jgi:hypothetical protein
VRAAGHEGLVARVASSSLGFQPAGENASGYYSGVPEKAKKFLTEAEWDYWYGGKPAATDIIDPTSN